MAATIKVYVRKYAKPELLNTSAYASILAECHYSERTNQFYGVMWSAIHV